MKSAKWAELILIAAVVVACAQTPKPTPQQPVADMEALAVPIQKQEPSVDEEAEPLAMPKQEPNIVTDARNIASAQRTLNQLGHSAGKTDGIVGPRTRQAIQAFQKDRGLVEDGRLTVTLAHKLEAETFIVVRPGDFLVYSDGETELVAVERKVQWNGGGTHSPVAIRPSMAGWPPAARTGLDWAVSHALDDPTASVKWSSTGVDQKFDIYASELTPGEAALTGRDRQSCRHFEMRPDGGQSRYPAIACRDGNGSWFIPHSLIRFARPATELGSAASSNVR